MKKTLKTLLAGSVLAAASALGAQAQDVMVGANAQGQTLGNTHVIENLIDQCASEESSGRAIMACTKLLRLNPEPEVQLSLMTQRALHRVAQGNHKAASLDFERAANVSNDSGLQSLANGFESLAEQDFAMAEANFKNSDASSPLAEIAAQGLDLTATMVAEVDPALFD